MPGTRMAKCGSCGGRGIVADPHHGQAFNCAPCGGTGHRERCESGSTTLPCIRPKGHASPVSPCFAIARNGQGVYLPPSSGKDWCEDKNQWPEDILPYEEPIDLGEVVDRRAAVESTKAKHAAK